MIPTRREFELAARFVGVKIDWRPSVLLAKFCDENGMEPYTPIWKLWAPQESSSDACEMIAKVEQWWFADTELVGDKGVQAMHDYHDAKASGDANQLCQAAFMLAVAIQEEKERGTV